MSKRSPVVLMVLDGWGYRDNITHNAIANAHTPQWNTWWQTCPHRLLEASGEAVGLPDGQMGNSEVGHMHIGAGRTVLQDYTFINDTIANGHFATNPVFLKTITDIKQSNHAIHIMGLLSEGGVHSHQNHLFAFLDLCAKHHVPQVYLHLFLDGRDTPPQSAQGNIATLQNHLSQYPGAKISTISGRYYAMDRDQRWPRIEAVYDLLVNGASNHHASTVESAITAFYKQGIFDEFIPPTQIGKSVPIQEGDAVFFFNFRADRARQLTHAFLDVDFKEFNRPTKLNLVHFISMTQYDKRLSTECAFPPRTLHNTLGEIIAEHGLKQLRIAETEKYAHVTFFLNGGSERLFLQEDRVLIPSPKIATYDLQPEMSSIQLTKQLVIAIEQEQYDVIICNYANADMVGHSGDFAATVKAIEALDTALHDVGQAIRKVNGQLLITADHGNAECMFDEDTQQPHTAHTCEPVPLLYIGDPKRQFKLGLASLSDVAPTLLALLDIVPPPDMTGRVLWVN
ncbi:MAG: 2,3-bisphosphoglycerate-independent phosphoglycerate mutase [Legionellaceae bacterium]|nr:2,3-bisphosphoglycerate-independent phosphoglycerate mutase [Legionellaceae bacterium]